MKRLFPVLFISLAAIIALLFLAPVSLSREKVKKASGVVTSVYEAGYKDAILKISGLKNAFYINRAFEKQFSLNDLRQKLLGKKVTILYADAWTPFDPGCNKHIAEVSVGEDLLYSELK